ncbi:hypothetical protein EWM64_g7790 [Hericium alpestre]|uniref:Cytochrome P450 n=1 Tax=Hericium alpestre TaxID=135208 RepID=A0A4Y9ZN59_9AGAM|nr:hypothetical protein EWM64_g7790 [Hericium alpestre]
MAHEDIRYTLLTLLAVVLVSIIVTKRRRRLLPLPPGPPSLPLIGCFLSIPKRDAFMAAAASVTLAIAYGYKVAPQGDSLVEMLEESAKLAIEATLPFASAVNDIPGLKYLPGWFPGMGFKARAKHCRTVLHEVLNAPLEDVQRSMADGTAVQSLASELLKANEASGGGAEGYDAIRDVTGSVYTAGAETTSTAVNSAILALVLHPDVQWRAQAEIDSVIGRDRLPDFDDRASMPYVDAVCREVIRWKIVNPLGLPRRVRSDDVYEGHFIPKGALLFPNTWAIVHDPERYPEPFSFKPERFLLEDGSLNDDEVQMKFGFGRRICPGRHVADASVWIMVSSILAVFDICHAKGEHGKEIPIDETCIDGLVSRPLPFECAIVPRDAKAATLIRSLA